MGKKYKYTFISVEKISPFDVRDPCGNVWHFPGGMFSTDLYPESLCEISAGELMDKVGAEHLPALRDLRALTELAHAVIEGRDADKTREEMQRQALRIFHNNLRSAYAGVVSGVNASVYGERTRDVFSLASAVAEGDHIEVDWLAEPVQVRSKKGEYGFRSDKTLRTRIPCSQGIVEPTSDGLYNPDTGMPFSTKRAGRVGVNPGFWKAVERKIVTWGQEHEKQIDEKIAGDGMKPPSKFNPRFITMFFDPFPELDYGDCTHLLRQNATYGFSHQEPAARLSPKNEYMVLMRGMDEFLYCDPDCVSVGYNNFPDCGMSARFVLYQR